MFQRFRFLIMMAYYILVVALSFLLTLVFNTPRNMPDANGIEMKRIATNNNEAVIFNFVAVKKNNNHNNLTTVYNRYKRLFVIRLRTRNALYKLPPVLGYF